MNLIFITIDGARVDRIVQGKNYCKLIEKSAFFQTTITYAPFTIAALHAVFSGTYGNHTGVNSYWSTPNFKKDKFKTLTNYLHDQDYFTYGDCINKLVIPRIGFDKLVIHDELHDDLISRHISLIDKMSGLNKQDKKFFLYLHYSNIHTGIMQEVLKKYDNFSDEYFKNKEKNEKLYDILFNRADDYLGKIFNHFEQSEISNDTLLVVISDHGISIGEKFGERAYGVFCYDYTLKSTALFYHNSIPKITVQNQIRSIDILPTILEILSIPIDENYEKFQGKSLLPIIKGNKETRIAFSQSGNPLKTGKPPKEPNVNAIRTDDWKYIKNTHDDSEELYNLKDDPNEEKNLISIKKGKADEMRSEMNRTLNW